MGQYRVFIILTKTTISRFEALNLSFKNMCKLKPLLAKWLDDADNSMSNNSLYCNNLSAADSMGRRRKKRTSIETTVRIAMERAFAQNVACEYAFGRSEVNS